MAATVSQVIDALQSTLRAAGLRCYDRPADIQSVPAVFVLIESVEYHGAFRLGDPVMTFTLTAVVARTSDRAAYDRLSEFIAPTGNRSIRQIVESDRTLGGVCQTLIVQRAENIRMLSQGDADYLAVDVSLVVHA
jgi:hypothetical protein